jgi:hypothetical protein
MFDRIISYFDDSLRSREQWTYVYVHNHYTQHVHTQTPVINNIQTNSSSISCMDLPAEAIWRLDVIFSATMRPL